MERDKLETGAPRLPANKAPSADLPEAEAPTKGVDADLECLAVVASEQPADGRFDLRVFQALRRIIRAVDLHSRRLMARHQITGPQLVCLLSVEELEPVTPSAIARHIHLSPSTVIGILDRLEAKRLVRRERDLKDRRLVKVSLTEAGTALARTAPSPLQDTLADGLGRLTDAEQSAIAESLDRIVVMMEAQDVDAAPILAAAPNLEAGPADPPNPDAELVDSPGGSEPGSVAASPEANQ